MEINDRNTVEITERPGYAYVPFQRIGRVYTPEKAMVQGTVFPELDIGIGEYERGLYDGK
ncbi:MAG: spore coat associated protein CotJA [Ruminiclostridium sp.]|nr:spore coat associated protein CotJA [Ruminiclostridium sp.]